MIKYKFLNKLTIQDTIFSSGTFHSSVLHHFQRLQVLGITGERQDGNIPPLSSEDEVSYLCGIEGAYASFIGENGNE
ncbi:hypothetical protein ACSVDA_14485 [Cytobacillus sp. Hm23]